nr:MAG TPA: hypothetical protein [Caudoviricetes sp.]
MDFYKQYMVRYMMADAGARKSAKQHWVKCHLENVASGRDDLITFSAKILGAIGIADELMIGGTE